VTVPERQDRAGYDVNLAAYLPEQSLRSGAERTRKDAQGIQYRQAIRSLGIWHGQESVFRAPLDSFPADATHVAVLLQRAQQGPIAGSATVALR